jgi:hypothetical protein
VNDTIPSSDTGGLRWEQLTSDQAAVLCLVDLHRSHLSTSESSRRYRVVIAAYNAWLGAIKVMGYVWHRDPDEIRDAVTDTVLAVGRAYSAGDDKARWEKRMIHGVLSRLDLLGNRGE